MQLTACIEKGGFALDFTEENLYFSEVVLDKRLKKSPNGIVCLVRDKETGRPLIYRQSHGSSATYRAMQTLCCPYLPAIVAVEQKQEMVYVLEEYIRGDRLDELLSVGHLSEGQASQIIRHLALALRELHRMGIVHRDVKPENVILRGDEAVLIDFDASRMGKPSASMDTQVMGTAGYAAPEQYGFSQTDARSDVYALGVLFNVMLTGQHPAKCLTAGKYEALIGKCIEVNADRRYDSIASFLQALEQPPLSKRVKQSRRQARITGGLTLCFVAILILTAALTGKEATPIPPPTKVGDVLSEPWGEASAGYATDFSYDLDGDGAEETYVFGIAIAEPLELYGNVLIAESFSFPSDVQGTGDRRMVPCVWRMEGDELTMEYAFAELLKNQRMSVRYLWDEDVPQPQSSHYANIWDGGIWVQFGVEHAGTWLYSACADLGGVTLTAAGTTTIYIQ